MHRRSQEWGGNLHFAFFFVPLYSESENRRPHTTSHWRSRDSLEAASQRTLHDFRTFAANICPARCKPFARPAHARCNRLPTPFHSASFPFSLGCLYLFPLILGFVILNACKTTIPHSSTFSYDEFVKRHERKGEFSACATKKQRKRLRFQKKFVSLSPTPVSL